MSKNESRNPSAPLSRNPGHAHLLLASPEDWASGARARDSFEMLSEEERERYESMGHPLAQTLFLTGRALARCALSHFSGTDPAAWSFAAGPQGRPGIVKERGAASLDFNLAHTDRLVVCLVTHGPVGGVDVENTRRSLDPMRMAQHSIAPEEVADLELFEGQARQDRFLSYWTLKEAYLKARGAGFSLLLDAAVFRLAEDRELRVRFAPRTEDDPADWQFDLFRAPGEHLVAIALGIGRSDPVRIVSRWAEPASAPDFVSARPIVLEPIASTHRRIDTR